MKILYFSYVDLDTPSACQTHTLGLIGGFAAQGCRVDAVVPRPSLPPPEHPWIRFHFLNPYLGGRRYLLREVPSSAWRLWSLCRRQRYDGIYARDMDVFVGPRLCSRFFDIPLFLEVDDTPVEGAYPPIIRKAVELNLKRDYRRAAGLIVPSVPRCHILHRRFGVPWEKIHMILNGAEEPDGGEVPDKARARERLGLPGDSFCLGYLGTVYERYDFAAMLAAMALCRQDIPNLYFLLVGGGPALEQVKGRAAALGLADRLLCPGFLPPQEFAPFLAAMDVGLMPLTRRAVLEHGPIHTKITAYVAFGLAVVTAGYSLKGYPAELEQGVWLVPPEDPAALAAAILHLYEHPRERQQRAAALARYVLARLTWKAVAGDILAVMEKSWKAPIAAWP